MLLYPQQPIFPLNGKYFPARSPQDIAAENALHKRMAAAYEDARKVWAENRERYALTGILSDAFPIGPSEPQKEVERFLVDYGWLPPRVDPVKEKEKSSVYEDSTPVPRIPRRNPLRRCLQLAIPQSRWNSTKSATTSVGTGPQSRAPFSPQKLWLSFRTSTTSLPGGFKSRISLSSPLPLRPRRKKCVSLGSAPAALPVPIVLPVPPETAEESPPPTPPPPPTKRRRNTVDESQLVIATARRATCIPKPPLPPPSPSPPKIKVPATPPPTPSCPDFFDDPASYRWSHNTPTTESSPPRFILPCDTEKEFCPGPGAKWYHFVLFVSVWALFLGFLSILGVGCLLIRPLGCLLLLYFTYLAISAMLSIF